MRADGSDVGLSTLALRHLVGLLLVEGVSTVMGGYLRQALTLMTGIYLEGHLVVVAYVLTMVSGVMAVALGSGLAIHDRIAGTRVVPV